MLTKQLTRNWTVKRRNRENGQKKSSWTGGGRRASDDAVRATVPCLHIQVQAGLNLWKMLPVLLLCETYTHFSRNEASQRRKWVFRIWWLEGGSFNNCRYNALLLPCSPSQRLVCVRVCVGCVCVCVCREVLLRVSLVRIYFFRPKRLSRKRERQ